MPISVFNLFSIGIGPSSSHTVGPMRAAKDFVLKAQNAVTLTDVKRIKIDLYGSLALTGKGHGTDLAVLLGLEGETPQGIDPDTIPQRLEKIRSESLLQLDGKYSVNFHEEQDLLFHKDQQLPFHPNALRITLFNQSDEEIFSDVYYSTGGGFILDHFNAMQQKGGLATPVDIPFPFKTAAELLAHCNRENISISEVMLRNELKFRTKEEVYAGILDIWHVMKACIQRGCREEGILPGGLGVKRRAKALLKSVEEKEKSNKRHPAIVMEWVSLWALAVNEENAAGGRVVTAPTNGAAGVIPAVLKYYEMFEENPTDEGIIRFFLTAAAMGVLFKEGASISAAEMGCMGEVGVACAMAAAGLSAAVGATNEQIENAAEIGMEHNLGLTCDPIMGLVQIPCIERNTMGAVKAINASLLALQGDGTHRVSLDQVIATMRQTGHDMQSIYKETSLGGLAVNVPEC